MSLRTRLTLFLFVVAAAAAAAGAWLAQALHSPLRGWLGTAIVAAPVVLWLAARLMRPIRQVLRALTGHGGQLSRRRFQHVAGRGPQR